MPPVQPPLRAVPRNPVPGPHNRQAEDEPARLHCLLDEPGMQFTTSGRAAILLGLEALGLAPTDRVLVPSYHCPTMVSPALALGQPVGFYPIDAVGCEQLPLPVFVDGDPLPVPTMAPTVGENTDDVMTDVLGLDDARIAELREGGAFG